QVAAVADLRDEPRQVDLEEIVESLGHPGVLPALGPHDVVDDARAGAPAQIVVIDRARGAEPALEGHAHGAPPGAARADQGAVDVEQDELHERGGIDRTTCGAGSRWRGGGPRWAAAGPAPPPRRRRCSSGRA